MFFREKCPIFYPAAGGQQLETRPIKGNLTDTAVKYPNNFARHSKTFNLYQLHWKS